MIDASAKAARLMKVTEAVCEELARQGIIDAVAWPANGCRRPGALRQADSRSWITHGEVPYGVREVMIAYAQSGPPSGLRSELIRREVAQIAAIFQNTTLSRCVGA
jgi:hypothetical protein